MRRDKPLHKDRRFILAQECFVALTTGFFMGMIQDMVFVTGLGAVLGGYAISRSRMIDSGYGNYSRHDNDPFNGEDDFPTPSPRNSNDVY